MIQVLSKEKLTVVEVKRLIEDCDCEGYEYAETADFVIVDSMFTIPENLIDSVVGEI